MADIPGQLEVTFESGVTLDDATELINKTHALEGFIGADSGGIVVGVASVPIGQESAWAVTLTADSDITSATTMTEQDAEPDEVDDP